MTEKKKKKFKKEDCNHQNVNYSPGNEWRDPMPFNFCPWCGIDLRENKDAISNKKH